MNNKNKYSNITLEDVKKNPIVNVFIKSANDYLGTIGYTEHGIRHVSLVASISENILLYLEYPKRIQELAGIAGYMHDIGNVVNRKNHGQSAAIIAMKLLKDMGTTPEETALIISAIGNHEEEIGDPVNPIAAALILADKS
ncbi:MAG: HD domain-containing protein, partial [Endomicrobium sp.]|nr:HD domain-containing protein [Endomicrobium sp.]